MIYLVGQLDQIDRLAQELYGIREKLGGKPQKQPA